MRPRPIAERRQRHRAARRPRRPARRWDGAEQHEVDGGLADALEHEGAEAAAADQRRDGGQADVLHQHDADAGEDHRQGERQLDAAQAPAARSCPCRAPRRPPRGGHAARGPSTVFADHRQQRVEEQRDQRRRGADAADAELRGASGTCGRAAPSGAIRMPNSAMLGMVWTTLSDRSTAARSRGRRGGTATPSGSADQRRRRPPSRRRAGRAGSPRARRRRRAWRIRAAPRGRSNRPEARHQADRDRRQRQRQHPRPRARPQPGERIGRHQPKASSSSQKPPPGAMRASGRPAGSERRAAGRRRAPARPAEQRGGEADLRARDQHGDRRDAASTAPQDGAAPRRQRLPDGLRVAGGDAVGLEDQERQQSRRRPAARRRAAPRRSMGAARCRRLRTRQPAADCPAAAMRFLFQQALRFQVIRGDRLAGSPPSCTRALSSCRVARSKLSKTGFSISAIFGFASAPPRG